MKGRGLTLALLVAAAFAAPASAHASITIGSDLGRQPTGSNSCTCTFMNVALPSGSVLNRGLASPVNGTVTGWTLRTGVSPSTDPNVALRVIRPQGGGKYLGVSTGPSVPAPTGTVTKFPASLPISKGDMLGINCCANGFGPQIRVTSMLPPGTQWAQWNPALVDGASTAPLLFQPQEIALQAEIEPSTVSLLEAKRLRKGKLKLTVSLLNGGTLSASGRKMNSDTAASDTPVMVELKLKPLPKAKKKLRQGKKFKTTVTLTFAPNVGDTSVQTFKVKLKP